jgi:adenylate kinase
MSWHVALTGTPGTGKSRVASELGDEFPAIEIGPLGERFCAARRDREEWEVDVPKLCDQVRRHPTQERLWVGHISHLLPVRAAIVLRCHPIELWKRLENSPHPGARRYRSENAIAEALSLITGEALRPGRRVWEVDTTGRSVSQVARDVARLLRERPPSLYGEIDWLREREVTDRLPSWDAEAVR